MSPVALGLALSLHALAAAVLWWATPLQPIEPADDALMVTVDSGAPPTTVDSPSDDKPAPPEQPREEPQQALAKPPPPQPEQPLPQPVPPPPSLEQALEQALAPPEELPPPTTRDFPKPVRLAARPPPPPPQGVASQAAPRPSPPAPARPPANAPASVPGPPSNSSDWLIGQSRARNTYLDLVARHTSRYRSYPRISADNKQEGRVVTRVTIGRDGRLIDVKIGKSSGWPAIDAAELEAIRRSAPFPPVPADMPGDPLILNLPINYELPLATRSR